MMSYSDAPSLRIEGRRRTLGDWLGRLLNCAGAPGAIRAVSFHDDATGQDVTIQVGSTYVCLTINGRNHYFHRLTGSFEGSH